MSDNRIRWSGLDELKAQLRDLPADLTGEAAHIVEAAANGAAQDIKAAYPVRTGTLRNGLQVTHFERGRFSVGAVVKNTAKHAYLFEHGTQARHTAIGANRGSMPAGNVFIPRARRWRARMYDELKALLVRYGLRVSGDVAA